MRAATPTLVAEIPFIVRRAGGLEAGEAPWRRTAFRTRGFFPSRRERTRQSSAYQPAVEARNRTAAPRDCPCTSRRIGFARKSGIARFGFTSGPRAVSEVRTASGHAVVAQARSALPLKTD